jgi:hypothetical protein
MFDFTPHTEPPTAYDLKQIRLDLLLQRKQLLKLCGISDISHILLFALIYFFNILSGRGVVGVLIFSSTIALVIAAKTKAPLHRVGVLQTSIATCAVMTGSYVFLTWGIQQPLLGTLLATLGSGSIVFLGSILGSRAKAVFRSLENLESISEDAQAQQELQLLSHRFIEINNYRQQARDNLRPNLTYGELKAMKQWARQFSNHMV